MSSRKLLIHATDNVSASKLITFNVPSFETIDDFLLEFTNAGAPATQANILSSISRFKLSINGLEVINISPEDLVNVYKTLGSQVGQFASGTNVLGLNIAPLIYKLPTAEDAFSIGCEGFGKDSSGNYLRITNIQVQVQCTGTVTDITDVTCYTQRRNLGTGNNVTRAYCKLLTYPQSFATTGESTVDTLPRDMNEGYLFVLANKGAGTVSHGECLINNTPVIQKATKQVMDFVVAERGFAPIDSAYNYLFTDGGTQDVLSLNGVTDLRFKTTFSKAPGTYNLIAASIRAM